MFLDMYSQENITPNPSNGDGQFVDVTLGYEVEVERNGHTYKVCWPWFSVCKIKLNSIKVDPNGDQLNYAVYNSASKSFIMTLQNQLFSQDDYDKYLSGSIFKVESYNGSIGYELPDEVKTAFGLIEGIIHVGEYSLNRIKPGQIEIIFNNVK